MTRAVRRPSPLFLARAACGRSGWPDAGRTTSPGSRGGSRQQCGVPRVRYLSRCPARALGPLESPAAVASWEEVALRRPLAGACFLLPGVPAPACGETAARHQTQGNWAWGRTGTGHRLLNPGKPQHRHLHRSLHPDSASQADPAYLAGAGLDRGALEAGSDPHALDLHLDGPDLDPRVDLGTKSQDGCRGLRSDRAGQGSPPLADFDCRRCCPTG